MFSKTTQIRTDKKSDFLHVVAKERKDVLTIKVFDIKGKKAKTINKEVELSIVALKNDMIDLEKGHYVLNAFKGGNFIKSFRFIKE
jgi:hypothetical protein